MRGFLKSVGWKNWRRRGSQYSMLFSESKPQVIIFLNACDNIIYGRVQ